MQRLMGVTVTRLSAKRGVRLAIFHSEKKRAKCIFCRITGPVPELVRNIVILWIHCCAVFLVIIAIVGYHHVHRNSAHISYGLDSPLVDSVGHQAGKFLRQQLAPGQHFLKYPNALLVVERLEVITV